MTNYETCAASVSDDALKGNPYSVAVDCVENDELDLPPPSFKTAPVIIHRKSRRLRGRASRAEFWYWMLHCLVLATFLTAFAFVYHLLSDVDVDRIVVGTLAAILITPSIPTFSVAVRRFHDCDYSAAPVVIFALVNGVLTLGIFSLFFPVNFGELNSYVNWIIKMLSVLTAGFVLAAPFNLWFIRVLTKRGTSGVNRYGDDPTKTTSILTAQLK